MGLRGRSRRPLHGKLQAKHPEWNIYNFGVAAYGTDQEFLLLKQHFNRYKPRLVFLVFCSENDDDDNSINHKTIYFKPYYTTNTNGLMLNGVPVPRSERVFWCDHPLLYHSVLLRLAVRAWKKLTNPPEKRNDSPTFAILAAMQRYVSENGALLMVGLTDGNPELERFLRDSKIPCVNLATPLRFSEADIHWTPAGHTLVCARIEEFILASKCFDSSPPVRQGAGQ